MNPARIATLLVCAAVLAGCASAPAPADLAKERDTLRRQVIETERAFARTMADRDFNAFQTFLSDEAIFFSGPTPLRGKAAVAAGWKRMFEKKEAPFSWEPVDVEVLDSGTLAQSSGPVRDPTGKVFATFTSVWRLEAPGIWRIVLDKGNDVCDCAKP